MWPWEHLALGYLAYSLGRRTLGRGPPAGDAVVVLLVATQLPDLIDKPLSWGLGWTVSGYTLGHAVLLALPVSALAMWWASRGGAGRDRLTAEAALRRRRLVGAAIVGHWSHLLGDVLSPLRTGAPPAPERVLWPVVARTPYATDRGLARGIGYLERFAETLTTADPASVLVLYAAVPLATLALWIVDGAPGAKSALRLVGRLHRDAS